MSDPPGGKRDFFVSFNQAARAWATWVAWTLEEAGYSVFFQDWDFQGNFVLEMDRAHAQSRLISKGGKTRRSPFCPESGRMKAYFRDLG